MDRVTKTIAESQRENKKRRGGGWQFLAKEIITENPDGIKFDDIMKRLIEGEKEKRETPHLGSELVGKMHKEVRAMLKERTFKKQYRGERLGTDTVMTWFKRK